jgi:colanic acid/amylovoran biosynthesis glycosyltransferase
VSEGFCNAVLEAQAMQLPVVASDADGLPENVAHGQTGFIVPRRNPAALADKLALLAGDMELRRKMGAAGRARVEDCFTLPQQIAAFDRFFREMVNGHED